METKIYINNKIGSKWKEMAMKRFGYGKGSISKAAEEALTFWVAREEKVSDTIAKLEELAKKEGIEALLLFGSYARKEIYSDIDIAVVVKENVDKINLLIKFTEITPTNPKFDFLIFNDIELRIKSRILSECVVLYSKNISKMLDISADVILEWSDKKPILNTSLV